MVLIHADSLPPPSPAAAAAAATATAAAAGSAPQARAGPTPTGACRARHCASPPPLRRRGTPSTMPMPGNPRGTTSRCISSGGETGRRRVISVVVVLPVLLSDHADADRATLDRRRRPGRPEPKEAACPSAANTRWCRNATASCGRDARTTMGHPEGRSSGTHRSSTSVRDSGNGSGATLPQPRRREVDSCGETRRC
jgi:hypothetical protein